MITPTFVVIIMIIMILMIIMITIMIFTEKSLILIDHSPKSKPHLR